MIQLLSSYVRQSVLGRWQQLTEPASTITVDVSERHYASLIATIALSGVTLIIANKLVRLLVNNPENPIGGVVSTIAAVWLLIAYALSRTKYYALGAFVLIVPISVLLIVHGYVRAFFDPNGLLLAPIWLAPVMLVASYVFTFRGTAAVAVGDFVLTVLIRFFIDQTYPGLLAHAIFPYDLLGFICVIALISSVMRNRYVSRIEIQAHDLLDSEERYRSLFESGFVGIVVHENGVILEANAGFLKSLGYRLDEVRGQPLHHFFLPVTASRSRQIMDSTRFEMMANRKDGTQFRIEIYRRTITYRGRCVEVLAFHDISEHKQAEEERVKWLAERERSYVLRQFISDASHDLRTPLATINTSLYLLRKTVPDESNVERHLDSIQAQAVHLNEVLESLLLMARLDDPETYFELTMLDLNEITRSVLQACQPAALKKGHTLDFSPEPDLPPVQGDVDEIRRAVRLLLDNALAYTSDGGNITIRTRRIHKVVVIEVEDNGPGISPEDLPHIFQRFYRGDKARGQAHNVGVGLGLPIAQKIIEAHGGTIDVETHLGMGSTFQIFLPAAAHESPH
jgi:PAS domain S-box-containing protein